MLKVFAKIKRRIDAARAWGSVALEMLTALVSEANRAGECEAVGSQPPPRRSNAFVDDGSGVYRDL